MKINQALDVEPGRYHGKFVRATKTTHDRFGPGLQWDFEIDEGQHARTIISRTTKPDASKRNICGAFCEMVAGLPVETAIQQDTEDWVGVCGTIVIESSPSGNGIRVAEFARDPHQPKNDADTPF